jgi:hypothetical protein
VTPHGCLRTDVSEERVASIIMLKRIGELGMSAVTSNFTADARCEEFLRRVRRLLVTASVLPSSPALVTLMNEASVLTRATWPNIPEDAILHSIIIIAWFPLAFLTGKEGLINDGIVRRLSDFRTPTYWINRDISILISDEQ